MRSSYQNNILSISTPENCGWRHCRVLKYLKGLPTLKFSDSNIEINLYVVFATYFYTSPLISTNYNSLWSNGNIVSVVDCPMSRKFSAQYRRLWTGWIALRTAVFYEPSSATISTSTLQYIYDIPKAYWSDIVLRLVANHL